ncbi:thioredoxin-disulfide reductase [Candidatus Margulisiibacteriota bacterium]
MVENVIIIGSGPAGHTAAIYTARANLKPLMFEGNMAGGIAAGGQLTTTTKIDNFPGFSEIGGFELMTKMREQSVKNGTRIETKTVDKVDVKKSPYKVYVGDEEFQTKTVIIATGAIARRLGLPGEKRLWQKGVSACAVCDGGLPIFRDKHLIVIGGGDTAIEEALHLTHFGSNVTMLVRRDVLRASKTLQKEAKENKKIDIKWNTNAIEILGDKQVTGVKIKNNKTNEEEVLEIAGLFYAVGFTPNTDFLKGQIDLDNEGYIKIKKGTDTQTNIPGVFAAGDVCDKVYRQAVVAAGTGCKAAIDAERFLNE